MNKADMLYDLSFIWSAVKEVFPYFDRLSFDWDERYRIYLDKVLQVSDASGFHRLLTEFMEELNDGHTKYIPPKEFARSEPYVQPDEPSYTITGDVLTIKINEFLSDHSAYIRDLLESNPNVSLVRLDIRNNIGGNTHYAAKIAELFIPGTFQGCQKWTQIHNALDVAGASQIVGFSKERIEQYIRDGLMTEEEVSDAESIMHHTKYKQYTDSYGTDQSRAIYDGPLQILISKCTVSAAEDFTAMFKSSRRGTLIGEPTCGSTGTPYIFKLRCGGRAQVVSVGYRLLDGTEFIGKGIVPDIAKAVDL